MEGHIIEPDDNNVIVDGTKQILDGIINALGKIKTITEQKNFLKDIEKDILETNNLELFYNLCTDFRIPFIPEMNNVFSKAVIESKNPEYNYLFARDVQGIDVDAHENAIIESKDPKYNYYYVSNISRQNAKTHGNVILKSGNAEYNYLFARNIEQKNIRPYSEAVIKSENPEYNYKFLTNERWKNKINKYAHAMAIIRSENLEYNCLLLESCEERFLFLGHSGVISNSKNSKYNFQALSVIEENLNKQHFKSKLYSGRKNQKIMRRLRKKHLNVLIENKDIGLFFEFISGMDADEKQLCSEIILKSKDLNYNYVFAKKYQINVLEHGQVIIDSKDLEYNFKFANYVDASDIDAHSKVIIESKNLEYNYKFAKYVKNADIYKHRLVILEAKERSCVDEKDKEIIDLFLKEFPLSDYLDEVTNVKNLIKRYNKN